MLMRTLASSPFREDSDAPSFEAWCSKALAPVRNFARPVTRCRRSSGPAPPEALRLYAGPPYAYDGFGHLTTRIVRHSHNGQNPGCPPPGATPDGFPCQLGTYDTASVSHYGFDAADNLDTLAVSGASAIIGNTNPGNRLSTWGTATFATDSDGNRTTTSNTGATYRWSSDGRLLAIVSGSNTRTYDYDNFGQLVRRSDNGTPSQHYLWDHGQLMLILDGNANNRVAECGYIPGSGDHPFARITLPNPFSSVHYYAQDVAGNIIGQFSGTNLEEAVNYDPWGLATVGKSDGDTTELRWKGLLYESGITSLYYVRARWYDSVSRRFVSPDPLGLAGGINQFACRR
jgi:RHS repeat-associated protein